MAVGPTFDDWNTMFQVYAVVSMLLFAKYFVAQMTSADPRAHPKEDFDAGIVKQEAASPDLRKVRIFGNDMENIPFHYGIFVMAFIIQNFCNMSGAGKIETLMLTILIVVYASMRYLFTICFLFSLQPWRSIAFVVSIISVGKALLQRSSFG
jgi:uncharacterized membrane protein YecN with MAPEG domain